MEIIINNSSRVIVDSRIIRKLAGRISKRKWIVSLSFVSGGKMKSLNRKYRGKDKPTDVLSFIMREGKLLGDIAICPEIAKANVEKFGTTLKSEIARLVAHGLLHLLGYRHGKRMFALQEKALKEVGYA